VPCLNEGRRWHPTRSLYGNATRSATAANLSARARFNELYAANHRFSGRARSENAAHVVNRTIYNSISATKERAGTTMKYNDSLTPQESVDRVPGIEPT